MRNGLFAVLVLGFAAPSLGVAPDDCGGGISRLAQSRIAARGLELFGGALRRADEAEGRFELAQGLQGGSPESLIAAAHKAKLFVTNSDGAFITVKQDEVHFIVYTSEDSPLSVEWVDGDIERVRRIISGEEPPQEFDSIADTKSLLLSRPTARLLVFDFHRALSAEEVSETMGLIAMLRAHLPDAVILVRDPSLGDLTRQLLSADAASFFL